MRQRTTLNATERRSATLLFAYGFGNAAAYVVVRTIADSAFLSRVGAERLPQVYLAAAAVVALVSFLYGRLVRNTSLRRTVVITLALLAATSAAAPSLIRQFPTSPLALAAVYLLAQVRGSLGTIQYTMLLNEQFAHDHPERVVGVVGLGATMAGFGIGFMLGEFGGTTDILSMMYLAAAIDLLSMLPVVLLPETLATSWPRTIYAEYVNLREAEASPASSQPQRSYVLSIAGMMAVGVVAATLVEYQWKATVAAEFHRDEQQLARYFGFFYGAVFLVTGGLQLFATKAVLQRRGVRTGLLLFPAALLLAAAMALFASTQRLLLRAVTLAKGCDVLKRSMNDPCVQMLYGPLDGERRHQAITFVAGIAKPLAEAAAAVILIALAPVSVRLLSALVLLLVLAWIGLDVLVYRTFKRLEK